MSITEKEHYAADAARFTESIIGQIDGAERLRALLTSSWETTVAESDDRAEIERLCALLDLAVDADQRCSDVIDSLNDLTAEWGYGYEKRTVVRVVLAGGGPAGWIDFTMDEDNRLVGAEVGYVNWWQEPVVTPLSDELADAAYALYSVDVLVEGY